MHLSANIYNPRAFKKTPIDIWGSCVSRDAFGIPDDEGRMDNGIFKVEIRNFFQNCSIYSQFYNKTTTTLSESDLNNGPFLHDFIKKCVLSDWNKDVTTSLKTSGSTWIVVDFMGERSGFINIALTDVDTGDLIEESIITDAIGSDAITVALSSKYHVKKEKIELNYKNYSKTIDNFIEFCKLRYGSHIILIEPIFCQEFIDDTGVVKRKLEADKRTETIFQLNSYFIKKTKCYSVPLPFNSLGDTLHKWKENELHYVSEIYDYLYSSIEMIISSYPHYNPFFQSALYDETCSKMSRIKFGEDHSVNNLIQRSKRMHLSGEYDNSLGLLLELVNNGISVGYGELGRYYSNEKTRNLPKSIQYYREAVNNDIKYAYHELFEALWKKGDAVSYDEAFSVASKGVRKGIDASLGDLGRAYRDGKGCVKNINKAVEWMRIAASNNVWWAKEELFDILWNINSPESLKEMVSIRDVYKDNTPYMDFRLGRAYRDGKGVEKDLIKSSKLMRKAVNRGLKWAKEDLIDVLFCISTHESYSEMILLCNELDSEKKSKGALYLARAYREGLSVKKDFKIASDWYNRAITLGNSEAQLELDALKEQIFLQTDM